MNRRFVRRLSMLVGFALLAQASMADDIILTLPGDAITAAMGEATTASLSGAASMFGNPAGLARSDVGTLSVMHTAYLENINYTTLAMSRPFGFRNASGFSLSYLNFGSVPSFDSSGTPMPAYTPKDICLRAGVARSFFRTSVGASLFYLRSKIAENTSAFGGSFGLTQIWGPISWALAIENAGPAMSYRTESHPLPTQTRLAGSFQLTPSWMVNVDAVKPKEGSTWLGLGNEFRMEVTNSINMSLRGGYDTRNHDGITGLSGLSAGAGFGWKDSALNYAWVPFGDLGQTHRISFQVSFGEDSGGRVSDREHRNHPLLSQNPLQARRRVARSKVAKAAIKMPFMPWKKGGPGWRTARDKMMTLLAQDALCSNTGARALITRTNGTVVMQTDDREFRWPRLGSGQYMFEADTIRTYANASADLVFPNGTKAKVGPNSTFSVKSKKELCDQSITALAQGDVYLNSHNGHQLRVETPLGDAVVENAEARLQFDGKTVSMRVQHGAATFISEGVSTPVQELTTFEKTAKKKSVKTNDTKKPEPAVDIADATRKTIPGRWDPAFTSKFQAEIMRLDSVPGLQLGEYLRDVNLRNELKLKVYDLQQKGGELLEQQVGLDNDVQQFEELRKKLSAVAVDESDTALRDRLKSLKQAVRVLSNAKEKLGALKDEVRRLNQDLRSSEEFLAAMPIVRMLNITAEDSTIPFEPGRAVVSDRALEVLNVIGNSISVIQPFRIVIEGHTDQTGSRRNNIRLSKDRAEAVAAYLRKKTNLPPRMFLTKGRGSSQPLVSEEAPDAGERNRRVEIWLELRGL